MYKLPNGLKAFAEFKQFIVLKVVKKKRQPVDCHTGRRSIDPFKPANWVDAATAITSANRLGRKQHNMELHTEKYVYALTGNPTRMGNAETDGTKSLHDYIKTYFPPSNTLNNQYLQTISVRGAGNHIPLCLQDNIVCRCSDLCSDVFKAVGTSTKGNESCDLTSIEEFLRLGGAVHGYPDYNA